MRRAIKLNTETHVINKEFRNLYLFQQTVFIKGNYTGLSTRCLSILNKIFNTRSTTVEIFSNDC